MTKESKISLIPPDLKRCQAEVRSYRPFALGPAHQSVRCSNKPVLVVSELEPGKDGQKGSMSLCAECFIVFGKLNKIDGKFDLTAVKP